MPVSVRMLSCGGVHVGCVRLYVDCVRSVVFILMVSLDCVHSNVFVWVWSGVCPCGYVRVDMSGCMYSFVCVCVCVEMCAR